MKRVFVAVASSRWPRVVCPRKVQDAAIRHRKSLSVFRRSAVPNPALLPTAAERERA